MKKTLQLFCVLILFILFGCFIFSRQNRTVQLRIDENNMPVLSLKADDSNELLYPWFNESDGLYYFFLPSFVDNNRIYFDLIKNKSVSIDGLPFFRLVPHRAGLWARPPKGAECFIFMIRPASPPPGAWHCGSGGWFPVPPRRGGWACGRSP